MNLEKKEYNSLDILKFVLSIFVLVIHSEIDKTIISPLLRIAVPIFFIVSSYLFFSKVSSLNEEKQRIFALKRLVKRNIMLYLFWVVVQLPIIIFGHHFHINFFTKGIWETLKIIILGQACTGSWYIIALVIGSVLIYFASKKLSAGWLVVLTLPLYIMCCFTTNYRGMFIADSLLNQFNTMYENVTQCAFNTSLPGGLFWIAVGNFLARKPIHIKTVALKISSVCLWMLVAVERYYIVKFGWQILDDCYFTLILLCPVIFLLVKQNSFTFKSSFRFREISTLIYVMHGSCGRVVGFIMKMAPGYVQHEIIKVGITIVVVLIVSIVFLGLRDRFKFKVLKYAC